MHLALVSDPKILLLDEPFAALDVMTIKILQEIIVNLQSSNNISVILCDHQARDLLACVDTAAIIHNGKKVAYGTPSKSVAKYLMQEMYILVTHSKLVNQTLMKNQISINKTIKPFNKILKIEGDKSLSIRWALLASQALENQLNKSFKI